MKLVDTSSWVHALRRKGDQAVRDRVVARLDRGEAIWCEMVRLELCWGASSDWDKALLEGLESHIKTLPITPGVWQRAVYLSQDLRRNGITVPAPDLIIFGCGNFHNVKIEHSDQHFDILQQLYPI
ncbi:MAG: PIN domain-containing protein [Burkholderiales bacterium]|nr:PIN domain-containing protein [Phycisphaerae bacterium]